MLALVKEKQLLIQNNSQPVQGSVGEKLSLRFSEDWAGLSVTAVFSAGSVQRDVAVEGDALTIPWELYAGEGHPLWLNFHGAKADGSVVLRTPRVSLGVIRRSDAPSGSAPEAPTPTRADQIQAMAEQALAAAEALQAAAAAGSFDGADGEDGVDGYSPTVSVTGITGGHRVSISDADGTQSFDVMDGSSVTADPALSGSSVNTVQNKVVTAALTAKADAILNTAGGAIASFPDGADGAPVKRLLVSIKPVQSGSGDPAPDNVRPIGGWTGMNVKRTGSNLNPRTGVQYSTSTYPDGVFLRAGSYVFSTDNGAAFGNGKSIYIMLKDRDGNVVTKNNISGSGWNLNSTEQFYYGFGSASAHIAPFTLLKDCCVYFGFNNEIPSSFNNLMLNIGSSAMDWEPYSGTAIPVSWQSAAGTVYGGTLDVTAGVLTVDTIAKHMTAATDSFTFISGNGYYQYTYFFNENEYKNGCSVNALCSIFPKIELSQRGTVSGLCNYSGDRGYRFALKSDMGIDTVDKFRQFITDNPLYVTAELAVPVTYQLTPAEVRTLLGVNSIWADTGSVSVEYRADTRRYIDSLTAPDRDMTADANIQSGKYFIVNNRLFLSTAAIAQGAAIVPGSNCSETDLAQALNALNS